MLTHLIDYIRIALYAILVVILVILFQLWDKDHPKTVVSPVTTSMLSQTSNNNYVPQVATTHSTSSPAQPNISHSLQSATLDENKVVVITDVMKVTIDRVGGTIIDVSLLKYPETLHSKDPFVLLNDSPSTRYIAQSGLLSKTGPDTQNGQAVYQADKTEYVLTPGEKEIDVILHWKNTEGIIFSKRFTFKRDSYEIGLDYIIDNQSKQIWDGHLYLQLMRKNSPPPGMQGFVNFATYFGAAISSKEKPFTKISFKEMNNTNLNQSINGGWAAMIQHYFISAWVPDSHTTSDYFTKVTTDGLYTIGLIGPVLQVNPGQQIDTTAKFYAGPAIADNLRQVAPGLQLTIDYGWLWFISVIIFWMMQKIYYLFGNWGLSIILVTLIIKLMFYHLSAKSYTSMSSLKKLQPKINALKERFGEDKQKFTQATLELYRKEKVNPMSGCLPILIQIPVFIALYWVLIESVELRQAPFIFWIHDLSIKDPYYVLPVLMGLSMFLQQRLNPPPPDPIQAKVMMLMPVLFTILFVNFPSGLMLYWFVNNTLSFLQQWHIMYRMEKADKAKKSHHS